MSILSEPWGRIKIHGQDGSGNVEYVVENKLRGYHTDYVRSVFSVGGQHQKIISISNDGTIRIWCSVNFKCLFVFKRRGWFGLDVIQLDESLFLATSKVGRFIGFSITSSNRLKVLKEFLIDARVQVPVFRLLRLTSDLFAVQSKDVRVCIMSYSQGKITKVYNLGNLYPAIYIFSEFFQVPLISSEKHPNAFYFPTQNKEGTICLVDYFQDRIIKEWKNSELTHTYSMTIFTNYKKKEILIVFDSAKNVFFWDTSHPNFTTNRKVLLGHYRVGVREFYFSSSSDKIRACFCFRNQYLGCGDMCGLSTIFEIIEKEDCLEMRRMKLEKIHRLGNLHMNCSLTPPGDPSELVILSSSVDKEIIVSKVSPIRFRRVKIYGFEANDRLCRVQFLNEFLDTSELVFRILVCSMVIVVPKSFL